MRNTTRTFIKGGWKEVQTPNQDGAGAESSTENPQVGVAKSLYNLTKDDVENWVHMQAYENEVSVSTKYKNDFAVFVETYMSQHHNELMEMLEDRFHQSPDPCFNSVRPADQINFSSYKNVDKDTLWRLTESDIDSAVEALGFDLSMDDLKDLYDEVADNFGGSSDEEIRTIIDVFVHYLNPILDGEDLPF